MGPHLAQIAPIAQNSRLKARRRGSAARVGNQCILLGPHTAQIAHLGCRRQAERVGGKQKTLLLGVGTPPQSLISPMSPMSLLRVSPVAGGLREEREPIEPNEPTISITHTSSLGGGRGAMSSVGLGSAGDVSLCGVRCLRDTAGALASHCGACCARVCLHPACCAA